MATKLYRYEGVAWNQTIVLIELEVVKETPCGYWLRVTRHGQVAVHLEWCPNRWMRKDGRYARRDERTALADFKQRKGRQINILKAQLGQAHAYLSEAGTLETEMEREGKHVYKRMD